MMSKTLLVIFLVQLAMGISITEIRGQSYTRIHADFTVKIKASSGGQSLTTGKVFYDRNIKQLIYYLSFPEKETWLTADTVIYQIRDGRIQTRTPTFSMVEFSVFHLALNSRLQDFGLKNTMYQVENVERDKDMVITTWAPPEKSRKQLGNILISVRNKQLFGVVFQDPAGSVLRKQFFEDYKVINGMPFPGKIVEIIIDGGKEGYQVTTFKNIIIDELENDSMYLINIGALR